MVRRPESISGARRTMNRELAKMNIAGETTKCQDRPVLYTEVRQPPDAAAELCGRDTGTPCPLLELCAQFGFTESVHADNMVYGGYSWKRGKPILNHSEFRKPRKRA